MANDSYGVPLVIGPDQMKHRLRRVSLTKAGAEAGYDEKFVQELVFAHPECLPIDQIDPAYCGPVPVCMEMNTPAGPLDALYVTATGRLVVLEAKLWRNPEARRTVVGQILDYAKELSAWDYEDLQREVSRRLGVQGNALYQCVKAVHPDVDEARFVDEVHTSLRRGRFLLLIVGDGIREGAGAIANFLETVGSLEFTFGLVELAIFENPIIGRVVQPRILAKTFEIRRVVVQLPEHATLEEEVDRDSTAGEAGEHYTEYVKFWTELLDELQLDDASQPHAKVWRSPNIKFSLPPSGDVCWISPYFAASLGQIGIFIRFSKATGLAAYDLLSEAREEIDTDLGMERDYGTATEWRTVSKTMRSIGSSMVADEPLAPENWEKTKVFFKDAINRYVNTFRHRLERIASDSMRAS